jgi:hypothetical protein
MSVRRPVSRTRQPQGSASCTYCGQDPGRLSRIGHVHQASDLQDMSRWTRHAGPRWGRSGRERCLCKARRQGRAERTRDGWRHYGREHPDPFLFSSAPCPRRLHCCQNPNPHRFHRFHRNPHTRRDERSCLCAPRCIVTCRIGWPAFIPTTAPHPRSLRYRPTQTSRPRPPRRAVR